MINETDDVGAGRCLQNLSVLREIGCSGNPNAPQDGVWLVERGSTSTRLRDNRHDACINLGLARSSVGVVVSNVGDSGSVPRPGRAVSQ